jgi:hypothetical protein
MDIWVFCANTENHCLGFSPGKLPLTQGTRLQIKLLNKTLHDRLKFIMNKEQKLIPFLNQTLALNVNLELVPLNKAISFRYVNKTLRNRGYCITICTQKDCYNENPLQGPGLIRRGYFPAMLPCFQENVNAQYGRTFNMKITQAPGFVEYEYTQSPSVNTFMPTESPSLNSFTNTQSPSLDSFTNTQSPSLDSFTSTQSPTLNTSLTTETPILNFTFITKSPTIFIQPLTNSSSTTGLAALVALLALPFIVYLFYRFFWKNNSK